jgi:hypothetical protein
MREELSPWTGTITLGELTTERADGAHQATSGSQPTAS